MILIRRDNLAEVLVKTLSVVLILYKNLIGSSSNQAYMLVMLVVFFSCFCLRKRNNSSLSRLAVCVESTLSAFSLWVCLLLILKEKVNTLSDSLESIALLSIIGLLLSLVISIKSINFKVLKVDLASNKSVTACRKKLEELSVVYRGYLANNLTSKLTFLGFVEDYQRDQISSPDQFETSPLVFRRLYEEGLSFEEYCRREKKAFLEYISNEYVRLIKR